MLVARYVVFKVLHDIWRCNSYVESQLDVNYRVMLKLVHARFLPSNRLQHTVLPRIERHAVVEQILPGCRYTSRYNGMPL